MYPLFNICNMVKIKYSASVFRSARQNIKQEIIKAVESSPEYRKEIARVFQMANRRIQNIEKAGLFSPAVSSLNKGDITGYTKFSMRHDWNELKLEYGKAVAFLRQPTSTTTGVRQYNEHLRRAYDLTKDEFDLMSKSLNNKLTSISDSNFVERYLMRYKDFTGELETAARDISSQIESEAVQIRRAIDENIERMAEQAQREYDKTADDIERILKGFSKFGL